MYELAACRDWALHSILQCTDKYKVKLSKSQIEPLSSILESVFVNIKISLGLLENDSAERGRMFPIMGPGMSAELWKVLNTLIHKIMDPDEYDFLLLSQYPLSSICYLR